MNSLATGAWWLSDRKKMKTALSSPGVTTHPKRMPACGAMRTFRFCEKTRTDAGGKLIPQSIDEYFQREVKPHLPDAWIEDSKTKTGYEINFTKYFYEFKPLRPLAEIKADILALEESSLELEKKVLL